MSAYESTGKTVEEAVSEGLKKLGLSIGEVQVDILEEGSKGLFGLFGSKTARVRLTVKEEERRETVFADSLSSYDAERRAPKKAEKPAEPAKAVPQAPREIPQAPREIPQAPREVPQAPKAERTPKPDKPQRPVRLNADSAEQAPKAERGPKPERIEKPARAPKAEKPLLSRMPSEPAVPAEQRDPQSDEGKVQAFLQELTRLMGLEISVHVHTDEEGNIRVSMQGDTLGILIGRRGETLDALQYLTSLHINRGRQEYTRVTLDSEGYRAKREDALVRLANRMANRAQRTGRKVSLEPMNPYERRILHSALQGHEGISTHSEGEEPNRHVVITVSRDAKPVQGGQSDEEE